jgi:trehalose synthase
MCGRNIAEGFGLTVTEAMWKGAVLIGDRVVGAATRSRTGSTSFLVDTATKAAARIVQFLRDRELRLARRRARPYGHAF